jgi:hypothetical protein
MVDPNSRDSAEEIERMNSKLKNSLERCRRILEDCESRLNRKGAHLSAANTNDPSAERA